MNPCEMSPSSNSSFSEESMRFVLTCQSGSVELLFYNIAALFYMNKSLHLICSSYNMIDSIPKIWT